jgi:predicted lipoprotein with Yx(FWY)xxD motif
VKRTNILLVGILSGVVGTSAVASAQGAGPTAHAAKAAKVQLRNTSLGKVLVNASGFTLYSFTRDSRNKNTCVKISECSEIWKGLSASARPTAGPGVKASLLSTITLPGGTKQVTYAGHPLYLYVPASERAETSYVGAMQFGGRWNAVNAAGKTVK